MTRPIMGEDIQVILGVPKFTKDTYYSLCFFCKQKACLLYGDKIVKQTNVGTVVVLQCNRYEKLDE